MKNYGNTLLFGAYEQKNARHWTIVQELEKNKLSYFQCHTTAKGYIGKCKDLWKQYKALPHIVHTVLLEYPGQYLMPIAWILTRKPRKKLVLDAFISLYDTKVKDRKLIHPFDPRAWLLFVVDLFACAMADEILVDTKEHGNYFQKAFFVSPKKIRVVYLQAPSDMFHPLIEKSEKSNTPMESKFYNILFYGNYIPLQGVEYIIEAARILQTKEPRAFFWLVGGGQMFSFIESLASKHGLQNIRFVPTVPFATIPDWIHSADLCLGIFGATKKTQRVIPHKVYEAMACGAQVLTARTPAIAEKYKEGEDIYLCNAADGEDLAGAISRIMTDEKHKRA